MTRNPCLCRAWIASFSSRIRTSHEMDLWNKNLPAHYNSVDHIPSWIHPLCPPHLQIHSHTPASAVHNWPRDFSDKKVLSDVFHLHTKKYLCNKMPDISLLPLLEIRRMHPRKTLWHAAHRLFALLLFRRFIWFPHHRIRFLKSTAILRRPFTPQAFA